MTDEQFRQLCNTFGFAPSRALRELLDAAMAPLIKEINTMRIQEQQKKATAQGRRRHD